jgi:hypothetical protein
VPARQGLGEDEAGLEGAADAGGVGGAGGRAAGGGKEGGDERETRERGAGEHVGSRVRESKERSFFVRRTAGGSRCVVSGPTDAKVLLTTLAKEADDERE